VKAVMHQLYKTIKEREIASHSVSDPARAGNSAGNGEAVPV
jgi:hypothetical protein